MRGAKDTVDLLLLLLLLLVLLLVLLLLLLPFAAYNDDCVGVCVAGTVPGARSTRRPPSRCQCGSCPTLSLCI